MPTVEQRPRQLLMCLPIASQWRCCIGHPSSLTVIMTTLDFISRSEALLVPPKYHLEIHISANHGSSFNVGSTNGIAKISLLASSASIAIGIIDI